MTNKICFPSQADLQGIGYTLAYYLLLIAYDSSPLQSLKMIQAEAEPVSVAANFCFKFNLRVRNLIILLI